MSDASVSIRRLQGRRPRRPGRRCWHLRFRGWVLGRLRQRRPCCGRRRLIGLGGGRDGLCGWRRRCFLLLGISGKNKKKRPGGDGRWRNDGLNDANYGCDCGGIDGRWSGG